MNRVLIILSVAVLLIAVSECQEECGNQNCTEDQCCATVFRRQRCLAKPAENQLCDLYEGQCPCQEGTACKTWMLGLNRCQAPSESTTTGSGEVSTSSE